VQIGSDIGGRFPLSGIARPVSATPATGSHKRHKLEQTEIILRAFETHNREVRVPRGPR